MEMFMKGEDALRQYDSQPETPFMNSGELDFDDVFGGPPRRWLRGCGGYGETVAAEEEEKPVFGGRSAVRRRDLHGDHFFDDIFRGDESYSSPWRTARPSVPAKSSKVVEFPTFASQTHDFAKILNEESDSRPKTDVKKGSQSCRWISAGIEQRENDRVEPQKWPQTKTANYRSNDVYTTKKTAYSSESLSWDSKILGQNSDDSFDDHFVELSDDLEQATPRSEASEETKALDTKIGQWSAGKKGNIRSLLSTLQYILWAGSEWQPIALVDLVEANPIKRAYQKALLRLHPDKLQQKGAASNHKYIAEKVFDILQEAWDHFNNVAPV